MTLDEIQKYRLRVPEPSHFNGDIVLFLIDTKPDFEDWINGNPCKFSELGNGEFRKVLWRDRKSGTSFWAWMHGNDGPVFPIPIESE